MTADGARTVGIDIGSRMTKIVRLEAGAVTHAEVFDTGHDPLGRLRHALEDIDGDGVVATGYGRHLAQAHLNCSTVTEIRACARAARHLVPDCDSAIDIGGQDCKAIELKAGGGFGRFEMNDRCAAGTGRFLEVMAGALGYPLEEFGEGASAADRPVAINCMCTVFAESEVVSLIARGEDRSRIALGLHAATARRVAAMASRVDLGRRAAFVGGVARNSCMATLLAEELPCEVVVPDRPELSVAIGAALIARDGLPAGD
jgi:predicted CoA-substrate-specific enzyme activase